MNWLSVLTAVLPAAGAGVEFMDEFGCDYEYKTVDEGITKYNMPDDWYAEFDSMSTLARALEIEKHTCLLGCKLPNKQACILVSRKRLVGLSADLYFSEV
jgi:hypothetical protein